MLPGMDWRQEHGGRNALKRRLQASRIRQATFGIFHTLAKEPFRLSQVPYQNPRLQLIALDQVSYNNATQSTGRAGSGWTGLSTPSSVGGFEEKMHDPQGSEVNLRRLNG
jgi:hypothetical protein